MKFERLYIQSLSTTFFEPFIFWVIAYFTLYINIEDFSNRFMGGLTSLLVLAALLSTIKTSLPQTSYFKDIDVWFLFFIMNIVFIIFVHIMVDWFRENENDVNRNKNNSCLLWLLFNDRRKMTQKKISCRMLLLAILMLIFFWHSIISLQKLASAKISLSTTIVEEADLLYLPVVFCPHL